MKYGNQNYHEKKNVVSMTKTFDEWIIENNVLHTMEDLRSLDKMDGLHFK